MHGLRISGGGCGQCARCLRANPESGLDRIASCVALCHSAGTAWVFGYSSEQLQESVRLGMSKFNIATEYFRACYHGVVQHGDPAEKNGDMFRLMMETSENAIDFVRGKMRLLNPNKFTF